jgi:L-threonylcarbamoyladenylate synthase
MDSNPDYGEVLSVLGGGGVAVYPTETLYALGCSALDEAACRRVAVLKRRPESKPLPLIVGRIEQLSMVAATVHEDVWRLAEAFWPGPLSVLMPAVEDLAAQATDRRGRTSVRVTPHPLASALSIDLDIPLTATSANPSGAEPAARIEEIDTGLLEKVDAVLPGDPPPSGGPPSTVVEPLGGGRIAVFRIGAVPVEALEKAGFSVRDGL